VIGTRVGNYRIESLIGEGGMGKVYLALHPGIGRNAAIKVLAAGEASDPQLASRFVTEARAANAIRHPNIVDIYDCGVLGDGTPYIVMEYLEGEPLSRVLLRGPVPLDDAVDWACQVAEALAAAHASSVVHRDLKPDNLFLVPDPHRLRRKQIKVLDFGIAKLQHRTLNQAHQTRTGSLLGTPLYMSPEQCMGAKEIDARTDIYSLGVILYEMVTGRRPFDGDGVYAIISMHVNDTPARPSTLRPDLPGDLDELIMQALAKAPADRQPSMAHVLSSLELARGNTEASGEALLRAKTASFGPAAAPTARPETSTIGKAAVSRSSAPTAPGSLTRRPWLAVALACLAAVAVYRFGLWTPRKAPTIQPASAVAPMALPAPAAPTATKPAPPASLPTTPETVAIELTSDPPGAAVWLGDRIIARTPGRYTATASAPLDLVFRLEGRPAQRIQTVPAAGLVVRATFPPPARRSAPASAKAKRANSPSDLATEIKTER
jgi:serine/threonine-protein kinase